MRLIGSQEHGLARIQDHMVEEVDGKAANVSRILGVETEQQVAVAARRVLPCGTCTGQTSISGMVSVKYVKNAQNVYTICDLGLRYMNKIDMAVFHTGVNTELYQTEIFLCNSFCM